VVVVSTGTVAVISCRSLDWNSICGRCRSLDRETVAVVAVSTGTVAVEGPQPNSNVAVVLDRNSGRGRYCNWNSIWW